jgi:exodeoxyribonuclease VII large subunit
MAARLAGLNPAVLIKRGYIMANDVPGKVITSVKQLSLQQQINLQFSDGKAQVTVEKITQGES